MFTFQVCIYPFTLTYILTTFFFFACRLVFLNLIEICFSDHRHRSADMWPSHKWLTTVLTLELLDQGPHKPEWAVASTSLTLPGLEEKTYTVSIFSLTGANHFTGNDTRDKHGQVHTLVIIFFFQRFFNALLFCPPLLSFLLSVSLECDEQEGGYGRNFNIDTDSQQ